MAGLNKRPSDVGRIVQDPTILSGKPVVRGTRIPVEAVLEYFADNPHLEEFLADYSRLTVDDVKACFAFAQELVESLARKQSLPPKYEAKHQISPGDIESSPRSRGDEVESKRVEIDSVILWEQIRSLEGETLPTMSGRAVFDVIAGDNDSVRIVIRSSGRPCIIARRRFEQARDVGLLTASVTPSDLRAIGIENPTYAAAIIRAVIRRMVR